MTGRKGAKIKWTIVNTLSIDSGTCSFADPMKLPLGFRPPVVGERMRSLESQGIPMVLVDTREDLDMPVEVASDLCSARMEFVSDIADVEGDWIEFGRLTLSSKKVLACDPFILHNSFYRIEFEMRPGTYSAQAFQTSDDVLGLRIVWSAP